MSNLMLHPYHMVDESPWPLFSAWSGLFLLTSVVTGFHTNQWSFFFFSLIYLGLCLFQWWRDICREGAYQGLHTSITELGLRWGMVLFIVSEVFFFVSFFWAFFHNSLSPSIEVGGIWPPVGIYPFNPMQVPLLNTIVLLSSGISITWAHHALCSNNHTHTTHGLITTILLGIYFTFLQGLEYYEASFTIAESIYGSTFFVTTGFHGLHVLIGTLFLMVSLSRHLSFSFSPNHHFGFEAAAWYWHFVDVVWLGLYLILYWWGGL